MFEEQYRKHYQKTAPSDALNDETLALMKEARDHHATEPKKTLRWRPALVLPIAGTAVAALAALIIVGVWMTRSTEYEDLMGDFDQAFSDSMADSADPETEKPGDKPNYDQQPEDETPGDAEADSSIEENKSEEHQYGTGSQPEDDQSEGNDENNSAELPVEDESVSDDSVSAGTTTSPADPYGPEILDDGNTETYLSIREFLNALAKKETGGYGKNYYNARELIIVPKLLPNGARFRHLHLNTENGKYSYSYLFTKDGIDYIIDIEVDAKVPKTLRDLNLQKNALAEEEILTGSKEDHLYFLFGGRDEVTVTLTSTKATAALTEEETATLLAQFALERCSLANSIVDMKY